MTPPGGDSSSGDSSSGDAMGMTGGTLAAAIPGFKIDKVDFEQLRQAATAMVPFGRLVGTSITELSPTRAVVEIPDVPQVTNHLGTVHAGALFTAADIAGAAAFLGAAATRLDRIRWFVVRGARSNFRKPARGRIYAAATVNLPDESQWSDTSRLRLSVQAVLSDTDQSVVAEFEFDYVCDLVTDEAP